MRKTFIIGLLLVCFAAVSTNAFAYTDIAEATIVKTGIYNGQAIVQVSGSPLLTTTIFYLTPADQNQQLAVILTALSLEKTVWMRVAATTTGSLVQVVYVNQ